MATAFDIADAIAERLAAIDVTALALLEEQYQGILDRLTLEIERLEADLETASAQGQPQRGQWTQRRLSALKDEVQRILAQWADDASTIIELEQERAVRNVRDEARDLILGSLGGVPLGARLPGILVPVEALNNLIGFLGDGSPLRSYFDDLADSLSERMISTYLDGVARGLGPKQIGAQVRTLTGEPLHRAQTLARTATINAYREAQRRIFEKNANIVKKYRWHATLDARCCPVCWAMHGTEHATSERMATHWNCFVEGTMIETPPVLASTKRWYVGDVINIRTVSGNILTVTPNHPILTPNGWVPAGLLNEGDGVISSVNSQRVLTSINPDYDGVPTPIENIVESFGRTSSMISTSVKVSPKDFHGDGIGSKIGVIRADSFLWRSLNSFGLKPLSQLFFINRFILPSLFTGLGTFNQFGKTSPLSTYGSMSSSSVVSSFFICSRCSNKLIGFGNGSSDNILLPKMASNNI